MYSIYRSDNGRQLVERRYREFFGYWPQGTRQLRVPTRQEDTFVRCCGPDDAPPLVLLHGAGSNSDMWIADAAAWSERFKIYAVDVFGERERIFNFLTS